MQNACVKQLIKDKRAAQAVAQADVDEDKEEEEDDREDGDEQGKQMACTAANWPQPDLHLLLAHAVRDLMLNSVLCMCC